MRTYFILLIFTLLFSYSLTQSYTEEEIQQLIAEAMKNQGYTSQTTSNQIPVQKQTKQPKQEKQEKINSKPNVRPPTATPVIQTPPPTPVIQTQPPTSVIPTQTTTPVIQNPVISTPIPPQQAIESPTTEVNISKVNNIKLPPIESCVYKIKIYSFTNCTRTQFYFSYIIPSFSPYSIHGVIWNFGDGATSNSFYPIHFFPSAGGYVVTLTLILATPEGACCSRKVSIEIKIVDCNPCELIKLNEILITDNSPHRVFEPSIPHMNSYIYKWTFSDNPSNTYSVRSVYKLISSLSSGWAQLKIIYAGSNSKICCEAVSKRVFGLIKNGTKTDLTYNIQPSEVNGDVTSKIEEYKTANPNDSFSQSNDQ